MKNVAIITGASSGIGREFASIHASKNRDLIIIARREPLLEQLKLELEDKYNVKVKVLAKDLTQINAAEEIYEEIKRENIQVEYLINNAGFGGFGKIHERSMKSDIDMINLNVTTLTKLSKLYAKDFVDQGFGKILNVASIAALMPGPLQAVYFATKAYVRSFTAAINEELRGTNVTATVLLPGPTATEFAQVADVEDTKLFAKSYSAKSVATEGYKAMERGKIEQVSGVNLIQKIGLKVISLAPKRFVLKQTFKLQDKK